MKTQIERILRQRFRLILGIFLFACLLPSSATANITVAEYMSLRAQAQQGNQGANARWRYYMIGLMDGMQSVHAPATARDADLHFCMSPDFAVSPKFFDGFIQEALQRYENNGTLRPQLNNPMAVFIALELAIAFPCKE